MPEGPVEFEEGHGSCGQEDHVAGEGQFFFLPINHLFDCFVLLTICMRSFCFHSLTDVIKLLVQRYQVIPTYLLFFHFPFTISRLIW